MLLLVGGPDAAGTVRENRPKALISWSKSGRFLGIGAFVACGASPWNLQGNAMPKFPLAVLLTGTLLAVAPPSQGAIVRYQSALVPESPGATGAGTVTVDYDPLAHTMVLAASWSGLSGTTTVSHIHCCTAVPGVGTIGVAVTPGTMPGFPAGLSAGSYTSPLLDLTASATYTTNFLTNFAGSLVNAEATLIAGFDAGLAYFNVHTNAFPGGEIRGFLQRQTVPEPATLVLLVLGLAGIGWSHFRQRGRG
jgi:hypothetical protein